MYPKLRQSLHLRPLHLPLLVDFPLPPILQYGRPTPSHCPTSPHCPSPPSAQSSSSTSQCQRYRWHYCNCCFLFCCCDSLGINVTMNFNSSLVAFPNTAHRRPWPARPRKCLPPSAMRWRVSHWRISVSGSVTVMSLLPALLLDRGFWQRFDSNMAPTQPLAPPHRPRICNPAVACSRNCARSLHSPMPMLLYFYLAVAILWPTAHPLGFGFTIFVWRCSI